MLSAKEKLKNAMSDSSQELDELSRKIRETFAGVYLNEQVAVDSLKMSLDKLSLQESAVDFEGPNKAKIEILAKIDKISLFLVEDVRDLSL